jgi:hypothetical protein
MLPVKMLGGQEDDTESTTHANRVATGRQSAAVRDLCVGIVRISKSHASTQMASETGSRSEMIRPWWKRPMLTVPRQFGTLTEKVTDYEILLKELINRVNEADARLIRTALDKVGQLSTFASPGIRAYSGRRQTMTRTTQQ